MPDRITGHAVAPTLDEAARLAHFVAAGGSAAVHLFDERWQHRVAAVNADLGRTPRRESMCQLVLQQDAPIYEPDATVAPQFAGNPFVCGDDPVRLYLSLPLRNGEGIAVGTLCVFDSSPRELSTVQRERLADLAALTGRLVELAGLTHQLALDALRDPLTGLGNRLLLSERLKHALDRQRRTQLAPIVGVLDLDGFKGVNDEHGHAAGDAVLVELARRLTAQLRVEDTVARLGGDELVVILEGVQSEVSLDVMRERLLAVFDEPFDVGGTELRLHGSLGLVVPHPDELSYEVLGRADLAMYEAKTAGKAFR